MQPGPDRYARALTAGLRSGALWYATLTLVMSTVAIAEVLLPENGLAGVVTPAIGTAVAAAAGLALGLRIPRRLRRIVAVGAFLVMEAGFAFYLATLHLSSGLDQTTASFGFSLFKIALIAYCVNSGRRWAPAAFSIAVVIVCETLCAVLGPRLGYAWGFDGAEFGALGIVVLASIGFAVARYRAEAPRRAFARAADEDALLHTRAIARSRAARVVHDTVLNDLAVLATSEPGPIAPALAARLSATLELLATPDWDEAPALAAVPRPGGAVAAAVERASAAGITVRVDGELAALDDLPPEVHHALGGAVDQCLSNIVRHAGTDAAELTVLPETDGVSVMITDDGAGFDEASVAPDRLGLAGSVRARIEDAGGTVRVFARPGVGTTVLLTVPRTATPGLIGSDA
ncbi:MAG TPA: ATP-binding protein [Amnibacterium sp.]|jgi:signal transduction histidine kinase|uniref:sensor histidine kinase n=1 Tax=Amnibacterium sp. TaxID=1872496 RepID=UPI002F92ED6D